MKIYSNYSVTTFSRALAALLVELLNFSNQDIWLITPYLKEFRLPIVELGDFSSLLGGQRDEIKFTELLIRIAQEHHLYIVTKPPGELIPLSNIKHLAEKLDLRQDLEADKEENLAGVSIVDDVLDEFNQDIDRLASITLEHYDTIKIGQMLQAKGAKLYYRENLHAKLLCTTIGALIGSANFTNTGLTINDELMLEITDDEDLKELQEAAKQIVNRSIAAQEYNLKSTLEKAGLTIKDYRNILTQPEIKEYRDFEQLLKQINLLIK